MKSIRRRLLANAGATTFGKILSVVVQIVSVPVLLHQWGTGLYGEWILLSTVPTYFAMSDIGFGNVAGNEMTMLVAAGKPDEALDVFQSVSIFITSISLAMCILFTLGIWFLPIDRWLRIHSLSLHDARLILLFLGLSALLTLQEGLFWGCFRCVGKYALGTMAKSMVMLSSFIGLVAAASLGASPLQVAMVMVLINAIGTLSLWLLLRHQIEWLRYGVRHAHWSTVRRLATPAISFMSFPVSNILSIQGILIVVGHVFGPVGVVTFSTARTISRSVLQALALINSSVWPEISAAFGTGSLSLVRKLHRTSCQFSILACIGFTILVTIFGNRLWSIWTLGKIETDPVLLNILLLQLVVGAFWYTSAVVPAATNNHGGIAKAILGASCLALVLAYSLMKIPFLGLRGAAVALVIGDMISSVFVLRTSLRIVEDTLENFLQSMCEFPNLLPRRRS
jgi:O-antigen/teichoic acid export membrane protein